MTKENWIKTGSAFIACITAVLVLRNTLLYDGGILFAGFLLLCVLIPGFLLQTLFGGESRGFTERLLLSFFLGLSWCFTVYYLSCLTGSFIYIRLILPLAGILSLGTVVFRWLRTIKVPVGKTIVGILQRMARHHLAFWIVAAGATYSYYLTSVLYTTPITVYNSDMQWHMGNIFTLLRPGMEDIRVQGLTFRYHYFSDLFLAVAHMVTKIHPFVEIMRMPPLYTPLLMSAAGYLLMGRVTRNHTIRSILTAVMLFVLPLFGHGNDITYQWLTNINALGLALPCLILVLLKVTDNIIAGTMTPASTGLCALLVVILSGLKGPFTVILLSSAAGYAIYLTICKKRLGREFIITACAILAGFLAIWALLLRSGLNSSYIATDRLFIPVSRMPLFSIPIVALGDNLFARLCFFLPHFIFSGGFISVPFLFCLFRLVRGIFRQQAEDENPLQVLCVFGSFISLGGYYLFDMVGESQNYFLYGSIPLITAAGAIEATRWFTAEGTPKHKLPLKVICIATAAAFTLFSAFHPYVDEMLILYTSDEMRAAAYVNGSIPEDSLIAVNRHEAFYQLSGLTGKQFYIEGTRYAKNSGVTEVMLGEQQRMNDLLFGYELDDQTRLALAKELGIDYFVQWINGHTDRSLHAPFGEGFEICFESEDVNIWKVVKQNIPENESG